MISKGVNRAEWVKDLAVGLTSKEQNDTALMTPRVTEVMGMGWSLTFPVISLNAGSIEVEVAIVVAEQDMRAQ